MEPTEPLELWRRLAAAPPPAEVAAEAARLLGAVQDAVAAGKAGKVVGKSWENHGKIMDLFHKTHHACGGFIDMFMMFVRRISPS